jgi:HD-like signal output (HDOD) protein
MLKKLWHLSFFPKTKKKPNKVAEQVQKSIIASSPNPSKLTEDEIQSKRQSVLDEAEQASLSLQKSELLFYDYLLGASKSDSKISALEYDILMQVNEALSNPDKALENFPQLPQSLNKLVGLLDADDFDLTAFCKVVEHDPIVATQLIAVANSAQYNHSGKDITDIKQSFMLLGSQAVKQHVLQGFIKSLATFSPIYFKTFGKKIWIHSDDTAVICRHLAKQRGLDTETAFLIGLVHDIGKIFIFKLMVESFRRIHPDEELQSLVVKKLLQKKSMELSIFTIRKWGLPAIIERAITDLAYYQIQTPKTPLGQLLLEANCLSEFCLMIEDKMITPVELSVEVALLRLSDDAQDYLYTRLEGLY